MNKAQMRRRAQSRVTTGTPALDMVLGGGIPKGAAVFVCGLPGAGKTVLCEQALFANAQRSESVLYVTTLSEPPVKLLQFSQTFEFFQPELIDRNVHYADIGDALRREGTAACLEELDRLLQAHRPSFMVLDSFKVFHEYFDDLRAFRAFAAELMILFASWEVTTLLVGEYSFDQIECEPEFAIADGIIYLSGTEEALRQKRYLNVVKMRGTDAFFGRHSFEIDESGLTVYPRMVPRTQGEYAISDERVESCIDGLSEMMGGGIRAGSVLLLSGGTGSGKTLTAMSFAVAATRSDVPALVYAFEESPKQLARNCALMGWDIDEAMASGTLTICHVSPSELDLDRHAIAIKDEAARTGAKLVIIDSVSAFGNGMHDDDPTLMGYLWALADHFKRSGVTLILVAEAYSFYESPAMGVGRGVSYLADAIILLRLIETGDSVEQKINVLKMRGSDHSRELRDLRIENGSVSIGSV